MNQKKDNIMKYGIIYLLFSSYLITSCQPKQQEEKQTFTIDSTLQTKVTSILENKLSELNALSGQAIIMEVQTGQIKAMVILERKNSANYQTSNIFSHAQESGLMHPISILAALETGKTKLSEKVDVGNGIYSIGDNELKDHNWQKGGYGEITINRGLASSSNIAIYKTVKHCFDNTQDYVKLLQQMSYGKPDCITGIENLEPASLKMSQKETDFAWLSIGYNQTIAPIQMLTFYNAIANNGKMVQPLLYKDSTTVINPQIANPANIDSLKLALEYVVTDGLGKPAQSDKVKVAGMNGTIQLEDGSYLAEFCGYFPADNPQYSIMVSIHKKEIPVSGGLMAGDTFRQIVDYMTK